MEEVNYCYCGEPHPDSPGHDHDLRPCVHCEALCRPPRMSAPDGLPIYELGDPEAPYGFSAHGGGYLIVRPPNDDTAKAVFEAGLPHSNNGQLNPGHTTWADLGPKAKERYRRMAHAAQTTA